jgi:hypothetical protein
MPIQTKAPTSFKMHSHPRTPPNKRRANLNPGEPLREQAVRSSFGQPVLNRRLLRHLLKRLHRLNLAITACAYLTRADAPRAHLVRPRNLPDVRVNLHRGRRGFAAARHQALRALLRPLELVEAPARTQHRQDQCLVGVRRGRQAALRIWRRNLPRRRCRAGKLGRAAPEGVSCLGTAQC